MLNSAPEKRCFVVGKVRVFYSDLRLVERGKNSARPDVIDCKSSSAVHSEITFDC